ncbi:putative lysophospholipase [Rhizophagus clarus]|uniref:Putative lysophospholipase n=1 Tax=Rhizophagus clarus TaxID=94130 RepID=A0A8H3QL93_9GLOM|nr:putative lysophospholipase [Rhizophagus clarus]
MFPSCTLCYIPYLPNDKFKENFNPCVEYFMNKLTYNEEEIDLMIKLAKQNWLEAAKEKVKNIVIEAYGKVTLLMYDHYSVKIGRIRKANEIIIPVEEKKLEAPFAIELFFQIKRRLQENFKIINEIECEIKKIKENNNIYATDAITYLKEVIKETPHTPKKKNL